MLLGVRIPRPPHNIIKIMRIRRCKAKNIVYPEGAFSHNFGDFFFYTNCTMIRVYGCDQAPHFLLVVVSPRLAFIEFIWKMLWMEKEHVRTKKGKHLPRFTVYREFWVGVTPLRKYKIFW